MRIGRRGAAPSQKPKGRSAQHRCRGPRHDDLLKRDSQQPTVLLAQGLAVRKEPWVHVGGKRGGSSSPALGGGGGVGCSANTA